MSLLLLKASVCFEEALWHSCRECCSARASARCACSTLGLLLLASLSWLIWHSQFHGRFCLCQPHMAF
jgi:hypothetical protein